MKKQILGIVAASIMVSGTAFADEPVMSKFKVTIGGFVKLDYAYNSTNLGQSGTLAPGSGAIPRTSSIAGQSDQSEFTARQSRLWLKVNGPELYGAKTSALIEGDFYGDFAAAAESPQFRMRLAYGAIDWTNTQILFGQAYEIFGPMIASTVDFRSGAAWGTPNTPRVPQVRLTQKYNFGDNTLKLMVGAQNPGQNNWDQQYPYTGAGYVGTTLVNNALLNYPYTSSGAVNGAGQIMFESKVLGVSPGYYGLSMKPLTLGVFGLYGNQSYNRSTTLGTITDESFKSWGVGFYSFVPILRSSDGKGRAGSASFEGQVYEAANMTFDTATNQGIINTGTSTNPVYNSAKGIGLGAQLIVYPTQELGITAGYGRRQVLNNFNYRNTANYQTYNENFYINLAYDFNAAIRLAGEYQYLRTNYGNPWGAYNPLTGKLVLDSVTAKPNSDFGQSNTFRVAAYYFF